MILTIAGRVVLIATAVFGTPAALLSRLHCHCGGA